MYRYCIHKVCRRIEMKIKLEDGRTIEPHFCFCGCGVLSKITWNGFQAVDEEDLTGLQVHEGGCFRNKIAPKVGDMWASIYCGQAGSVYVPFSLVEKGKETKVERNKIVWIGKYSNDFGYDKNIVIMEML